MKEKPEYMQAWQESVMMNTAKQKSQHNQEWKSRTSVIKKNTNKIIVKKQTILSHNL